MPNTKIPPLISLDPLVFMRERGWQGQMALNFSFKYVWMVLFLFFTTTCWTIHNKNTNAIINCIKGQNAVKWWNYIDEVRSFIYSTYINKTYTYTIASINICNTQEDTFSNKLTHLLKNHLFKKIFQNIYVYICL